MPLVGPRGAATVWPVSAPALKEWAVVIAAMLDGDQMVMLRKGGIGEKRFDVPHRRFLLLPTHVHQRPELLRPSVREAYPDLLAITTEPPRVLLSAWCEVADVHEVSEQAELDALSPFHVLGPDYAAARLKWRPRHPLMAIVARVHRITPPLPLDVADDMRGCRSWIDVHHHLPAPDPVLDDAGFAAGRAAIADALAGARRQPAAGAGALG
jgi:hypothetical protein